MTYLDHNHRKRENIRFLATYPLVQDLWCSPSRGVTTLTRGAPRGIQILGYCGEAKIRNTCITRVVHKDVWLAGESISGKTGFRTTTHSLEVPVNHIAGVKVAEALSDIR